MFTKLVYFFLGFAFQLNIADGTDLTDVTASLFPGGIPSKAVIVAYGDYNADKLVDIFVIGENGTNLDVLLAGEHKPYIRQNLLNVKGLTGVIPADYNGDALMDILIVTPADHKVPTHTVNISICWGMDEHRNQTISDPELVMQAMDQPTLLDFNADMLPDLLIEDVESKRVIVQSSTSKNFIKKFFHNDKLDPSPFMFPQSNAFLDVDGDYVADLVISTEDGYEVWLNEGGHFVNNYTVALPVTTPEWHIGQAAFSDIDQDGLPNLMIPVCKIVDGRCTFSAIYGLPQANDTMKLVANNFNFSNREWNFTPMNDTMFPRLPITLRFGDYNMDGYPDLILFLQYFDHTAGREKMRAVRKAVLFENVPCIAGANACIRNRTFIPDLGNEISTYDGAVLGSFFDLYEDGVLDILLVTQTSDKKSLTMPVLRAIRQTSTTDTCFMKVTVTSGLCYKNCPGGREPYGVNVPGPVVKFSTVSVNGDKQHSSATQLSQSAHYALHLPYVMFGLGLTPNFVDTIGIGIPVFDKNGKAFQHVRTQTIPNSQLVVIPYPNNEPDRWIVKLFVTPSQSVLITGAVLLGTCGFVAGIIGILHWRERREDMKEKRQESHKFHFDAM